MQHRVPVRQKTVKAMFAVALAAGLALLGLACEATSCTCNVSIQKGR